MNETLNAQYEITPSDRQRASRREYEEWITKRQKEHLERVRKRHEIHWRPCLHDGCSQCHGTGVKENGESCIHMISCPCPKCTPTFCLSPKCEQSPSASEFQEPKMIAPTKGEIERDTL